MILPAFKYHQPRTVQEAIALAQACAGDFDFLAGGTDLLPNYKMRLNPRRHVISLTRIPELQEISPTRIGALARLREVIANEALQQALPVIPHTARQIASPLLQAAGTVGGNLLLDTRCYYFNQSWFWRDSKGYCLKAAGTECLVIPQKSVCYATYSGDLAPVFLVLGASLVLQGPEGRREVPCEKFFTHDGITRHVKLPEEILTHVLIPAAAQTFKAGYLKLRVRDSMDFPVLGVAAAIRLNQRTIEQLRVALTGVATTPLLFDEVTGAVVGDQLTENLIAGLADDIMNRVTPYRNVALSPQYRKAMIAVFIRRLLRQYLPAVET
ncbi:MAG: FAD binding domain-containing protein [candidate division KSB1 bacterium]|nr:FAD binding domain-containing protein [candidate division KSB1 bacterium]MDZ7272675.1 FAD binding domain-containing protein [candidate division KSB1 bacterium]MDZ7284303.1 FAD binding domain-containing protein [candidate division KSB1 bacterium]MDZ7297301.1 FAD binding domain-containing protein [candidate division KSB1 bacterium]MDZ7309025.1 FAD binding domain-containing protein [candidate division KSB1 bacterium]